VNSVEYAGEKAVDLLVDKDKLEEERENRQNQFMYLATP
jgi:hypothetical protein